MIHQKQPKNFQKKGGSIEPPKTSNDALKNKSELAEIASVSKMLKIARTHKTLLRHLPSGQPTEQQRHPPAKNFTARLTD